MKLQLMKALPFLSIFTLTNASPFRRTTLTAATIEAISPSASSCTGATFPDECRTAAQAAPFIMQSFVKYSIQTLGEQAALLALMLYESSAFKYSRNHWPGVPGQGTRNMQSPAFNLLYAESLYPTATVQAAQAQGVDAVLALVNGDADSFGSAAWFLSSQCSESVRQGLAAGTAAGWKAYLTGCVGTTDTSDRDTLWTAAIQAMKSSY